MTKGIEIRDLTIGSGAEATKESIVVANIREFLRRGDEVSYSPLFGTRRIIVLWRRECIAGLLKGIPGMRVGGVREIIISPHLAYGEAGIPGRVPANALLRCEVELIGFREHDALLPEDWIPGKILMVNRHREANHEQLNWSFTMNEIGNLSFNFFRWNKGNQQKKPIISQIPIHLGTDDSERLIQQALDLPNQLAEDCVAWDSGFIDGKGGLEIRDNRTGSRCMVVYVKEGGKNLCIFGVHEDSRKFLESDFYRAIDKLIRPHLESDEELTK
ncbi:MAG: FKBP-type peptidyl-prolyl cis-trans isomerase [Terracidiphilus sp.]